MLSAEPVIVHTAARLHFGVLDLRGTLGRWFGGIGTAAPAPQLQVKVSPSTRVHATGTDAERAVVFATRFLQTHAIPSGASIEVIEALPPHAGLGSGTQLGLAVARGLAELYGIKTSAPGLAQAIGRARRSAVGTWTFAGGGLVLEGGRPPESDAPAPLLSRLPFPPDWHCVVAVPTASSAVSGAHEEAAFEALPRPDDTDAREVAHLTVMGLLPAVADGDLPLFGRCLTRIQHVTGNWFAHVQGGPFLAGASSELVRRMLEWKVAGVGQSSWGPTVYGIVSGSDAASRLAERLSTALGRLGGGHVYHGPFPVEGASVRRAEPVSAEA